MTLNFEYSFGYKLIKNSVAFYDHNTIMFSAGMMCVLLDLHSLQQRSFHLVEQSEVTSITRSDNHILVATKGCPASVCMFQIRSESKKVYTGPATMDCHEFVYLSVSKSLKFVAAQSGPPDWMLVVWLSNTREVLTILSPCDLSSNSVVHDISFNAFGRDELVVAGSGVFKLYEYENSSEEESCPFVQHVFEKFERSNVFYSIAWSQNEILAVGSSDCQILFFRGIDFIHKIAIMDDLMHLKEFNSLDMELIQGPKGVTSLHATTQFVLCILSGIAVLVYTGEEVTNYGLFQYILLPTEKLTMMKPGEIKPNTDFLTNLFLCPSGKDLVVTTQEGQLLRCSGFTNELKPKFIYLLKRQHNEPVIDVDIAISRPLIASCSHHVVTLWNYLSKEQEIRNIFLDEISSIAIHPCGLHVALSFRGFCKIFNIHYSGFRDRKRIFSNNCSKIKFSPSGHIFAIVSDSVIRIYSFASSELIFKLDGHAGFVICLVWKDYDSKLVSCDSRGVICEWNLVSGEKNWENTVIDSYLSASVNSETGHVIAVGSNKILRCLKDSSVQWEFETKKQVTAIAFRPDENVFYVGTTDGCLLTYSFPLLEQKSEMCVHCSKISTINLNYSQGILVSAADNSIFIFRLKYEVLGKSDIIYSNLSLLDRSQLEKQQERLKQVCILLEYVNNSDGFGCAMKCMNHETKLRELALEHEKSISKLNQTVVEIKEEILWIQLDSGSSYSEEEISNKPMQEFVDSTFRLENISQRNKAYAKENEKIVLNYIATIESLDKEREKYFSAERDAAKKIENIKMLERRLELVEESIASKQKLFESKKHELETKSEKCGNEFGQKLLHRGGNLEYEIRLKLELKKLRHLAILRKEDAENRRNMATGQVDYDIKLKINAISSLKNVFQKLESSLMAKEKMVQTQEEKFCQMRTKVSDLQKCFSVSNMAFEELNENINSKILRIESRKRKINIIMESIAELEEEFEVSKNLCSTVTEKVGETIDGLQEKQQVLRETEEIISKYTSMLYKCLTRDCDLIKLVSEITKLLEEIEFADEFVDTRQYKEYDFQVEKLQKCYNMIKKEPARSMRDKSMAEFRLSQKNSQILSEVHGIRKETEKLQNTLLGMEGALIAYQTKSGNEDLRNKIDFVIDFSKRNRKDITERIEKSEQFIEMQQEEIFKFQTMLSAKTKEMWEIS